VAGHVVEKKEARNAYRMLMGNLMECVIGIPRRR
jgi:hypothetical protein